MKQINNCSSMVVSALKTDNLINPIGIDSKNPEFSWRLNDASVRGQKQTAYRITVAVSEEALGNGEYVWDSGKVESDDTYGIEYNGNALAPSTRYYWCVQVWDKDGNNSKSETALFETGLMDSGWSGAQWIAKTERRHDGFFDILTYTIDLDFKIIQNTASFVFGAEGYGDMYIWQISSNPNLGGKTYFRPHQRIGGGWSIYNNKPIADNMDWGKDRFIHLTIEVDNGHIKTYFDGQLFDEHKREAFPLGYIGFRKPWDEAALYDNIVIKDEEGKVIYSEDFEGETAEGFDKIEIKDGCANFTEQKNNGIALRFGTTTPESAPMFRKEFNLDCTKTVAKARLYFTSAGIYKAFINGKTVTDSRLNPGMTAYDDHMMYQTFDVTELLRSGDNAIGVYLGHGWWDRALRGFGIRLHIFGKLYIEYTDGTSDTVVTDDSWKFYRYGPILDDNLFNGFKFDGLKEQALEGWNEPGFDESEWDPAMISPANNIVSNKQIPEIIAQNIPLIKNTITLDALSVTEPKKGVFVYDFGQNVAGVVRIKATGSAGTVLKLRHAECLNTENMSTRDDDIGMIFTTNLPRAEATDTYVFKGNPDGEVFEPYFTYHGFRYVEVSGVEKAPALEDVKALLIMSDLEQVSDFECSHSLINRLYLNSLWSARDNFLSVPTDCPQRGERFGWAGDAQIFARTGSYMMDVNAFYQKYLMDIRDTSTDNRIIADVAPASVGPGWYGMGSRREATNGFGDAIVIAPYQIYRQYGNKRILEENYVTMCNWIDYLISTSKDYIRDESWTGDWMCVNEPKSPIALTDTAYCAYSAYLVAEIAGILGKPEDVEKYTDIYNKYRAAWRENFLEADGCTTKCGTQTSYVLGIKFKLFNENEIPGAAQNLVKNIEGWNWHISTGFLGYSFLNPILSDTGHSDTAYKLLEQTEYPSSLYSVTMGATTIWESWYVMRRNEDGTIKVNDESQNHFSYGSVSEWLFRYMLGIDRDDETSVAFKHFILKPQIGGSVTYAKGSYNCVRGLIESNWAIDEKGGLAYSATIPANTTATLYLPAESESSVVLENGEAVSKAKGVSFTGYKNGCMVFELESGSYSFTVSK